MEHAQGQRGSKDEKRANGNVAVRIMDRRKKRGEEEYCRGVGVLID